MKRISHKNMTLELIHKYHKTGYKPKIVNLLYLIFVLHKVEYYVLY